MIPIKKYKRSITYKDGKILECINVDDWNKIMDDFELKLIQEFGVRGYSPDILKKQFERYMRL